MKVCYSPRKPLIIRFHPSYSQYQRKKRKKTIIVKCFPNEATLNRSPLIAHVIIPHEVHLWRKVFTHFMQFYITALHKLYFSLHRSFTLFYIYDAADTEDITQHSKQIIDHAFPKQGFAPSKHVTISGESKFVQLKNYFEISNFQELFHLR